MIQDNVRCVFAVFLIGALFLTACDDDPVEPPDPETIVLGNAVENPDPPVGAEGVALDAALSWSANNGAGDFRVHFSDNLDAVQSASGGGGTEVGDETTFTPEDALEEGTRYFWRVDAVVEGVTLAGPVWSFDTVVEEIEVPEPPGAVSGPAPAQGATDVATDLAELSWVAGENADTYTVYFSDGLGPVVSGDAGAIISEGDAATTVVVPEALDEGTTWFWRVDAVNADGITPGPIWTFETVPAPAPSPPGDFALTAPAPEAENVAQQATLSWENSDGADTFTVFLSIDPLEVLDADEAGPALIAEQAETEVTLTEPLPFGITVFWRVIAENADGTTSSPIGRFTVVSPDVLSPPTDPSPADRAEDVLPDTALSWAPGPQEEGQELGTVTFDVYLGQDFFEVSAADRSSDLFQGNQPETTFAPAEPLTFDTTWFWRVDAVNESGAVRSPVWTFTTELQTDAPTFQGVQSATMIGTEALSVAWNSAVDDRDLADGITYHVFLSDTPGGQDFDTPNATVDGETTSVIFEGDELTGLLDNGVVSVVVRAEDSEGTSNNNTVEITLPIPEGLTRIFVDAAAAEGGDGSFGSPFDTIEGGLGAVANGGILLVAAGIYSIDETFEANGGDGDVHIVGGFPAFGDLTEDEVALLEARDPRANPAVTTTDVPDVILDEIEIVDGEEIAIIGKTLRPDLVIDAGRQSIVINGMSFEDISTDTLRLTAAQAVLLDNHFIGARDLDSSEPQYLEGELVNGSAITMSSGDEEQGSALSLIGNFFENGYGGVRFEGSFNTVFVGGNRQVGTNRALLQGLRDINNNDNGEIVVAYDPLVVTGDTLLHFEENEVRRSHGLSQLNILGQDRDNGGTLTVRGHRNRFRGVHSRDGFGLFEVGLLGDGGQIDMSFTENTCVGISSSMIEVTFARQISLRIPDPDNEDNTFFVDTFDVDDNLEAQFVATDNDMLHTNDTGMTMRHMMLGNNNDVSIEFRRNRVGPTESEGIEISSNTVSSNSDFRITEPTEPTRGIGARLSVTVADNLMDSTDELVEVRVPNYPDGTIDVEIVDNISLRDNGDCVDVDFQDFQEPFMPEDTRTDRSLLIARNHCETEDDFADIDLTAVAGDTTVTIENNTALAEQGGIELAQNYYFLPESFEELRQPQEGSSRVMIRSNRFQGDTDGVEGSFRVQKPDSEYVVMLNDFQMQDDQGLDISLFGVARTIVANNDMRSYDEGVIEIDGTNLGDDSRVRINDEGEFQGNLREVNLNWPMDLVVWNNDTHVAIRENLEVRWSMRGAEGNVYIAQNDAWGNTESEALDVTLNEGSAALVERNITGFNDVDSSEPIEAFCRGVSQLVVRNNIVLWGAGSGIEVDDCVAHIENNTIAFNGRESRNEYGIEMGRLFIDDEGELTNDDPFNFNNLDTPRSFGQTFVLNTLNAFNTNRDTRVGLERSHNHSLLSERSNEDEGFEVIIANPRFEFCGDQSRDFRACTALRPDSPAIDAGHPDERYNDLDGTRNDIGHLGGPHAGPMGYSPTPIPVPQVPMGLRPISDIGSGGTFLGPDDTLSVVFTLPLGDDFDGELLSVTRLDTNEDVPGVWGASGNRASFTPTGPALPAGVRLGITVDEGLGSDRGQATDRLHRFVATVASAVTAETEPNSTPEDATDVSVGVTAFSGDINPFDEDAADVYAMNVEAGDRLTATIFSARLLELAVDAENRPPVELRLTLLDTDGETVMTTDIDSIELREVILPNPDGGETSINDLREPYINHVFPTAGTYFLVVESNPLDTRAPGEEEPTEPFLSPYELHISVFPL